METIKLHETTQMASPKFRFFLENVFGRRPFIMIVTAPWCGHCHHFRPEFEKAVKNINKKSKGSKEKRKGGANKMFILDLSDKTASHISQDHKNHVLGKLISNEVSGFPTAIIVSGINNKNEMAIQHYSGNRTSSAIEQWIEKAQQL